MVKTSKLFIVCLLFISILPVLTFSTESSKNSIRIWTAPSEASLVHDIVERFKSEHPELSIDIKVHGPESTLMGVYTSVADIAVMGREMRVPAEFMAFTWVWQYPPTLIRIANTAFGSQTRESTLAVYLNKKNPINEISIAQLEAIFGEEHKESKSNIRSWNELGIKISTQSQQIHPLSLSVDSPTCLFFQHAVLADSYKWNASTREYPSITQLLSDISKDESAIGYGASSTIPEGVKVIAVKSNSNSKSYYPSDDSITSEKYPLSRSLWVIINKKPYGSIPTKTKAFLDFILSNSTQDFISHHTGYLPLSVQSSASEGAKLND